MRRRSAPSLALLAARARRGERRAASALRTRMAPDLRQLALALGAEPAAVAGVVRGALDDALGDTATPFPTAAVVAVQRRAAAAVSLSRGGRPAPDRLRSAVGVLCDLQGHSPAAAAALLGQPVGTVTELHAQSRSDLGVDVRRSDCRGWPLVARLDELTAPERVAGQAHLDGCRPCRDAVEARAAARARLQAAVPIGGSAAAGGVVVALLSTLGGGSMAAGGVAVGAAAVLGTAGVVVPVLPERPPAVEVAPDRAPADVAPDGIAPARPAGAVTPPEDAPPAAPPVAPVAPVAPVGPASTVLPPGVPVVPLQDGAATQPAAEPAAPAPVTTTAPPTGPEPDPTLPGVPPPTLPPPPEVVLPPVDDLPTAVPTPPDDPLAPVTGGIGRLDQTPTPAPSEGPAPAPAPEPAPTPTVTPEPEPESTPEPSSEVTSEPTAEPVVVP